MSFIPELLNELRRLSALEARIQDVANTNERIADKLDKLLDRLSRLEAQYEGLRANVKNEILGDLQGKLAEAKILLDLTARGVLPVIAPTGTTTAAELPSGEPSTQAPRVIPPGDLSS